VRLCLSYRAELSKLLSLPAVRITLAVLLVLSPALGTVTGPRSAAPYTGIGFLVLGVVAAASEYDGGQARTTAMAMPRRLSHRVASTAALLTLALPAAAGCAVATHLASGHPVATTTLPAMTGGTTLAALLASAAGLLLRHAPGTVALLVGYFTFVGPVLRARFPGVADVLPDLAPESARPLAVMLAWTLAALTVALVTYRHRDI
jgi:ABC-2 type transport system permease protein